MAARPRLDYRVVAALIAGRLLAGWAAASVIAVLFVVVVEDTGLTHRFGHHGEVLAALVTVSTIIGVIYVPIRWRSLARRATPGVGRGDDRPAR